MSIEGRIAVDVNFTDSATGAASSVKKIQLVDATAYSSGKVAIVTGTFGTAAVNVAVVSPNYTNASGDAVVFSAVDRIAFAASGTKRVIALGAIDSTPTLVSSGGIPAASKFGTGSTSIDVYVDATAGTAAFTAVFYGS